MRQFQEKTTLDEARESTEYTADAIEAWPDKPVQALARQDRSSDLYRAFIPDDLAALTDLSLEPESAAFTAMLTELKKKTTPEALRKHYVPEFERVITNANAAIESRKQAVTAIASADADFARWKDQANRRRRAVDGSLTTHAAEKGLPADFNERFQPAVGGSQRSRKKVTDPPTDPVAPT